MTSGMVSAIEFVDVHKNLGKSVVLDGVNFCVPKGAIVGLLGANGSGKSTCVRLLAGHTKADRGRVLVDGRNICDWPRISDHLAIVGDMIGLPTGLTVSLALATMTELLHLSTRALTDAIDGLGLSDRLSQEIGKLSKGWHQRVKLAVALAAPGRTLVLDEPTNGLDAASKQWLSEALITRRNSGGAVLLVTHEYPELQKLATEMVVIHQETLYSGPTLELAAYEQLTRVA